MDLGKHGEVFAIQEVDMLEYIKTKLDKMESAGEIQKHQDLMKNKTKDYIARPTKVSGLSKAKTSKTWEFDPTYILQNDIRDHRGVLIHPAGQKVNPLDTVSLEQPLIFIDGDDESQVEYALKAKEDNPKIILVNGSPSELMKDHKVRIYFDQKGVLINKFGIRQVPAIAAQKNRKILIQEVVIDAK